MNKLLVSGVLLASVSFGDIIYIPAVIPDLEHENAIVWNVNIQEALKSATDKGEALVGAQLYVADLWNCFEPELDALYVNLLDIQTPKTMEPIVEFKDVVEETSNFFLDNSAINPTWTAATQMDVYSQEGWLAKNYSAALDVGVINNYSNDNGWFGIGLDPDCYYLFDKDFSALVLETAPASVPEPATLTLLGCGLLSLVLIRRKRNLSI